MEHAPQLKISHLWFYQLLIVYIIVVNNKCHFNGCDGHCSDCIESLDAWSGQCNGNDCHYYG